MAQFSIPSAELKTASESKKLFEFLTDFKNFGSILPDDKVEGFTYDNNSCSFSIKGITPMKIVLSNKIPYKEIFFTSDGLGKFNFNLKVNFDSNTENNTVSKVVLGGDLNPFILKMAESALRSLVDSMNTKLSQLVL